MDSNAPPLPKADAAAALSWWLESGVDVLIADTPFDWLGLDSNPPAQILPPVTPSDSAPSAAPQPELAHQAKALVQDAQSFEALSEAIHAFRPAGLAEAYGACLFPKELVSGRPLILLGAPDEAEEKAGMALVGPAGALFDRMLAAIGLSRGQVTIAHMCSWRPAADRALRPEEESMCLVLARALISYAKPPAILALGQLPARTLLDEKSLGINRLRGKWRDIFLETGPCPLLASFTPDSLLRRPNDKKLAWLDLQALRAQLDQG